MAIIGGYNPALVGRRGRRAALLNASGLGAGYIYLHQWGRAVLCWLLTGLLVVIASVAGAAGSPGIWTAVYALWLTLMILDGHRRARYPAALPDTAAPPLRPWLPPAVGVLLIALVAAGLTLYRAIPGEELERAERAHAAGDCAAAVTHYDRAAAAAYEFVLSPALDDARAGRASCALLLGAEASAGTGDYPNAVADLVDYLARYGGTPPWDGAGARLTELRMARADALASAAATTAEHALGGAYRAAFEAYLVVRAEDPDSTEAAQVPERLESLYTAGTGELAERPCETIDHLRALENLSALDGPEAAGFAGRATDALPGAQHACGRQRFDAEDFCEAADEFAAVPRLAGATEQDMRDAETAAGRSLYECGVRHHARGDLVQARDTLRHLLDAHPDDPRADAAGDLLITIEIERVNNGAPGELPPPTAAGGAPGGTVTVRIVNDSPEGLDVLWSGPETGSASLGPCADCAGQSPLGTEMPAGTCDTGDERPAVTVTLAPGSYDVVVRPARGATGSPDTTVTSVTPFSGSWELTSGTAYSGCYAVRSSSF